MSHGQQQHTHTDCKHKWTFNFVFAGTVSRAHMASAGAATAASEQFCCCAHCRTATILDEHSVSVYSNDGSNSSVEGKSGDGCSDKLWAQRQLREACRQQLLTEAAAAKRVAAGRSVLARYNLLIREAQHRTHCRCC